MNILETKDILKLSMIHCKLCGKRLQRPIMQVREVGNFCGCCHEEAKAAGALPNKELEAFLGGLYLPCNYAERGCTVDGLFNDICDHEMLCCFREKSCPLKFENLCGDELASLDELIEHFKCKHADNVVHVTGGCISVNNPDESKLEIFSLLVVGEMYFMLRTRFDAIGKRILYEFNCFNHRTHVSDVDFSIVLKYENSTFNLDDIHIKRLRMGEFPYMLDVEKASKISLATLESFGCLKNIAVRVNSGKAESKATINDTLCFQCRGCSKISNVLVLYNDTGHESSVFVPNFQDKAIFDKKRSSVSRSKLKSTSDSIFANASPTVSTVGSSTTNCNITSSFFDSLPAAKPSNNDAKVPNFGISPTFGNYSSIASTAVTPATQSKAAVNVGVSATSIPKFGTTSVPTFSNFNANASIGPSSITQGKKAVGFEFSVPLVINNDAKFANTPISFSSSSNVSASASSTTQSKEISSGSGSSFGTNGSNNDTKTSAPITKVIAKIKSSAFNYKHELYQLCKTCYGHSSKSDIYKTCVLIPLNALHVNSAFTCKNSGCGMQIRGDEYELHCNFLCKFREYHCTVLVDSICCGWTGLASHVMDHLKNQHSSILNVQRANVVTTERSIQRYFLKENDIFGQDYSLTAFGQFTVTTKKLLEPDSCCKYMWQIYFQHPIAGHKTVISNSYTHYGCTRTTNVKDYLIANSFTFQVVFKYATPNM
ncbi:hypothetical protein Trydic_g2785 [Trypoxylus dichotomus]